MKNNNEIPELQSRHNLLRDFRYFALEEERVSTQNQTMFTFFLGLKETEITLDPLTSKFQCHTPRQIIELLEIRDKDKRAKLFIPNVDHINHKSDKVISVGWLEDWFRRFKKYQTSHPSTPFKSRARYDLISSSILNGLKNEEYCFYPNFTTIYEAVLAMDLLDLIYLNKILELMQCDTGGKIVWLIPEYRAVIERYEESMKGAIDLQSKSFSKLNKEILKFKSKMDLDIKDLL